ncbi:MAG: lysylphosphatidylglycerol synthase transmembrane domain-containing protein [Pseudomonadota bacterium]
MSVSSKPDQPLEADQPLRSLPRRTLTIALWVLPVVALGNVGLLVWSLGGVDLSDRIVEPHLIALAMALIFVPMVTNSLRLALWSRFFGLDLTFRRALKVTTGTMVANSVTPSATGGMPIKLAFLIGAGVETRRALALISFQTAEDAAILFSLVGLTIGISGFALFEFLGSDPDLVAKFDMTVRSISMGVVWVLVGLAALSVVIAAGLLGRRVRLWAASASRAVRRWIRGVMGDWGEAARRGKWIAGVNLVLALIQWCVRFSIAGLVLAAFGVEWRPALFWLLQYMVQSISSIVPTPGGAGGAEAGFLLLFAPFVDPDMLVPAMSTWRLIFFFLPLTGAALIFFLLNRKPKASASGSGGASSGRVPHPAE